MLLPPHMPFCDHRLCVFPGCPHSLHLYTLGSAPVSGFSPAEQLKNDPELGISKLTLFREILGSPGVGMPHVTLKWEGNSRTTLNWEFPFNL